MSRVKLRVNGTDFAGFKSGTVTTSLEQLCSDFTVSYFDARGSQAPTPIDDGDRCGFVIDDALYFDGWVDEANVKYDAKVYNATISGRSTTCDLVDCTAGVKTSAAVKTSWTNAPITAIVADILNPFGLQARLVGSPGANFAKFRIAKGETCGDAITRLVRSRGMVAYTEGSDLVIARAGATTTQTVIRSGDNVLTGEKVSSQAQRFSDYYFKGQTRANDSVNGVNAAHLDGHVEDAGVTRFRPMMVVRGGQDSKADLGQLAVLERNQRAGRGERLRYTIAGWENAEGLWRPNTRVRVIDTFLGVDCEMLVVSVSLSFGPTDGYTTDLELTRPEAFDVIDYPVRRRRATVRDSLATTPIPVTPFGNTDFALSAVNAQFGQASQRFVTVNAEVQRIYGSGD